MSRTQMIIPYSSMTPCGQNPFSSSSLIFRRLLLLLLLLALHGDLGSAINRRYRHRRIDDRYNRYTASTRYRTLNSQCYHRGNALKCMPNFDNVVLNRLAEATSTCGSPRSNVCRTMERGGQMKRYCKVCDAKDSKLSHPTSYLTDTHDTNNETCWISGPITDHNPSVNLTFSFGKRFEILYIYLVPCGSIPDSITLYKSSDFGKTWRPWRYFSSNCYRAFGLSTADERLYSYPGQNIQKARCEQLRPLRAYTGKTAERIVFSTTSGEMQNSNPALIDWRTATDLRIVLSKFPVRSSPYNSKKERRKSKRHRHLQFDEPGAVFYSLAQISVGGRCKCNGHSNQCIMRNNKLVCDCKHNTEGDDCERCKPFFYDRPWARATEEDANVCRQCTCNLHSNRCVFNKEVFLISGRLSGGVCQRCRHNTSGRACHYCKDGFYRDWTKPISHERVCLECSCHPMGSIGPANMKVCDKKTGQCLCKKGVTGQICDRCIEGYVQSSDPIYPCKDGDIPITHQMSRDLYRGSNSGIVHEYREEMDVNKYKPKRKCRKCSMRKRRIRFKKFCRKHYAIQVTIRQRTSYRNNVRFQVDIRAIYRRAPQSESVLPPRRLTFGNKIPIWIPYENLRCKCPNLVVGKSYLIISNVRTFKFKGRRELLLYHRSIVLDWQNAWKRRMNKYKRRNRKGRCEKILRRRQNRERKKVASGSNQHLSNKRFKEYRNYPPWNSRYPYMRMNYGENFRNYGYYGYNKKRV